MKNICSMQKKGDFQLYIILVLCSTFLQGSSFVASKIALNQVGPLWLAAMRFLVAAVSLAPVLAPKLLKRANSEKKPMQWGKLSIIGLLQTTGVMTFLNTGLVLTTAPKAAILMASNPLLVALLAVPMLGERVKPQAWCGLAIAFIGVSICIGISSIVSGAVGRGELLVMLGSVCWAFSTLLIKRFQLQVDPWVLSFWQMLIGSAVLIIIAIVSGQPFALPRDTWVWIAFLWLAIPASTGAMGLWFAALRLGGAVHTSGFLFLCPLFSALISFPITGEMLSSHEMLGGIFIAIGIGVVTKYRQ